RKRKFRGVNRINFGMYPPKARRITPFVTIPTGMARLFLEFFRTETACPDTSTPNRTNPLGFAIRWQGASTLCMPLAAREQTFKILARIVRHDGVPNEGAVAASVICPSLVDGQNFLIFCKISLDLGSFSYENRPTLFHL